MKVKVKGTGLTMVIVASMVRLRAPKDMEDWVMRTRSKIDDRGRPLPGTGRLGRTVTKKTVRVVEESG